MTRFDDLMRADRDLLHSYAAFEREAAGRVAAESSSALRGAVGITRAAAAAARALVAAVLLAGRPDPIHLLPRILDAP